ncbi:TetR family transcriptional regulator [Sphingopyxis sp. BSNA05]|uniref:TetR/AcrR family transcriptional regulator n=1 Tax=Sphingopyxis sp. BSNA05 TaxID=1236614 RepID=UPI0015632FEB|nr:TetR/AcrR family transcriptional regulator [Sphingopyxis sp. BSNA05]NRD90618.1 TetR family transcriptional regulator [Sphingopyxis sp. BSNA05]
MTTSTNTSGKAVEPRRRPRQQRGEDTIDRILEASAELLEELGFDKLNTNLICKRAGLTPPALYRYFPNKYAILKALGERLMRVQNDALYDTLDGVGTLPTARNIADQLRGQYDVTMAQKGGPWIMRALHATPQLADVRRSSHSEMVKRFVDLRASDKPRTDIQEIERRYQIIVETGYAVLEMLIDNPDMDVDATLKDTGFMLFALLDSGPSV